MAAAALVGGGLRELRKMITISIDAMGGDRGLDATVPAALEVLARHAKVRLILVGDARRIESRMEEAQNARRKARALRDRLQIVAASELVGMHESPAYVLRKKKDSSMRVAINLVHDGRADACISSGNTGALLATARFVLKTIRGVDRPAICAALPRMNGHTYVLDLGANVDSPPEILFQFGWMGSMLVNCLENKPRPSVGLLNIGVEDVKGNDVIKAAAELFKRGALNYVGYIEADGIYAGNTDLVVCDGFVGNVALKATEGAAQMIMGAIREEFSRNLARRGAGLLAMPALNAIRARLDHRRYNGASLLGLRGTVVKSHGGADAVAFRSAVEVGIQEVQKGLVRSIENALTAPPDSGRVVT
ncbi:MAG: phosphate acyltransferase PlsX [Gammaproteobacteria bacterium]